MNKLIEMIRYFIKKEVGFGIIESFIVITTVAALVSGGYYGKQVIDKHGYITKKEIVEKINSGELDPDDLSGIVISPEEFHKIATELTERGVEIVWAPPGISRDTFRIEKSQGTDVTPAIEPKEEWTGIGVRLEDISSNITAQQLLDMTNGGKNKPTFLVGPPIDVTKVAKNGSDKKEITEDIGKAVANLFSLFSEENSDYIEEAMQMVIDNIFIDFDQDIDSTTNPVDDYIENISETLEQQGILADDQTQEARNTVNTAIQTTAIVEQFDVDADQKGEIKNEISNLLFEEVEIILPYMPYQRLPHGLIEIHDDAIAAFMADFAKGYEGTYHYGDRTVVNELEWVSGPITSRREGIYGSYRVISHTTWHEGARAGEVTSHVGLDVGENLLISLREYDEKYWHLVRLIPHYEYEKILKQEGEKPAETASDLERRLEALTEDITFDVDIKIDLPSGGGHHHP